MNAGYDAYDMADQLLFLETPGWLKTVLENFNLTNIPGDYSQTPRKCDCSRKELAQK